MVPSTLPSMIRSSSPCSSPLMRIALPISPGVVAMVTSREILRSLVGGLAVNRKTLRGPVTKQEFVSELSRLKSAHVDAGANVGCVECKGCSGCLDCVFCNGCQRCHRSRYSEGCSDSTQLTHCKTCRQSHSLAYCEDCEHCGDSNYLIACAFCFECDYCFGCVGLSGKDFHILNRKYSRSEYFRLVAELKTELAAA